MATALKIEETPETGTDIVALVAADHSVVLFDEDKFDAWLRAKRENAPSGLDVTKAKDRGTIKSYVDKLRTDRATIKRDRLKLTEEWRDKTALVNTAGKKIDTGIAEAIDEILAPVTAWEEAEKDRVDECRLIIENMRAAATVTIEDTAASVKERGAKVWSQALDPERFGEMAPEAESVKAATVEVLKAALARLIKQEEDAARLAKLEAENAAREAKETAEREERERLEHEAEEARQVEEARIAAEQADAARVEAARAEAAEAERRRIEVEKQAEIDEANGRAAAAEEARAKIEHQREWSQKIIEYCRDVANGFIGGQPQPFAILDRELQTKVTATAEEFGDFAPHVERARVEALARLHEIKRQGDERRAREKRETDEAHIIAVMRAAKEAVMTCGIDEEAAKKVVLLIKANRVPRVTLEF